MAEGTSVPPSQRPVPRALRLLRFKEGESARVWITHHIEGGKVKGCFTRYAKGGSVTIAPEDKDERVQGQPGVWKGYVSAAQWDEAEKAWVPCVLEVTERAEQDFRGHIARGQIWKMSRAPKEKNKKQPLRAAFIESRSDRETPPAFCVLGKLRNDIFRGCDVDLIHCNPLPDLVFVVPVVAPGPGGLKEAAPATPEQKQKFVEMMRGLGFGGSQPQRNGHASPVFTEGGEE